MVFSSVPFLYYFLPGCVLLYFLAPRRLKNAALLLCSLLFYAWGEPNYVLLLLLSIAQGYAAALLIERYRTRRIAALARTASVVLSLALLAVFKYAGFFLENFRAVTGLPVTALRLALPAGISFYTFQILSYVLDVWHDRAPAQRSFVNLATYIAMFPQLIAGPIVRYTDIAAQLEQRTVTLAGAASGARRFAVGLAKKVLLADSLAAIGTAWRATAQPSVLFAWLYAVSFLLQIYFDFSGYSDMAIGLGRLFGFSFPENFNYPYISASITEFWRRWHISLGTWFRDYLYIPLGGNRTSRAKWYRNLLIVWAATGLWHGAAWNFLLWGLLFAVLLIAEKQFLRPVLEKSRVFSHIYVLFFITLSFVLFDADSISGAAGTLGALFGAGGLTGATQEALYLLRSNAVLLAIAALGATPLPRHLCGTLETSRAGARVLSVLEPLGVLTLLVLCTAYLVDGTFSPFLYFRF